MVDPEKLKTVTACDDLLKEYSRRWVLIRGDRGRWGLMDDINVVLERRLELAGKPKRKRRKPAPVG